VSRRSLTRSILAWQHPHHFDQEETTMKLTFALGFSIAAVVIATLGSTPVGEAARKAASQIVPRNSVGPLQLKRNAVTARKLSPNAVRTGHVLDGSLLTVDFKAGQIPQGPKGDKGDKGNKGDPGATRVTVRTGTPIAVPPNGASSSFARCEPGERVTGGGGDSSTLGGSIARSHPSGSTWVAALRNDGTTTTTFIVYVVCAAP
jgi:hypothetical protein